MKEEQGMRSEKSKIEVALLVEVELIFDSMVGLERVNVERNVENGIVHHRITVEGFAPVEEEEA